MKNQELHDQAWQLLEEKGLSLPQRMMVRSSFVKCLGYKDEYPFIEIKYGKKGVVETYRSGYDEIKHYIFETENEVILANAIYVNMLDENKHANINDFIQIFKFTCRIAGVQSEWTK